MAKPKKISGGVRLSVVLPKAQADCVEYMTLRMSTQEGKYITVSEALRIALETVHSLPSR
jgi:hypothetical protein